MYQSISSFVLVLILGINSVLGGVGKFYKKKFKYYIKYNSWKILEI